MSSGSTGDTQSLVRFRTSDGFLVNAFLVTKDHARRVELHRTPLLLQVHGLLGHSLARGTPRLLPHALLDRGLHSLSINTRLASAGQMNSQGVFDDTIHDIDAALEFLTQEGFQNIFILGYSLGASMVVHWAANRAHPHVRGLVLEGVGFSIPDSHRKKWTEWGADPSYGEVYERAKEILGEDPYHALEDETFVAYQARGPSRAPIHSEIFTYKTWWFMIGPEAHNAVAHRHIAKVRLPMLLLRGENDELVEKWEPEALVELVRGVGQADVRLKQIPAAGHDCMENPEVTVEEIVGHLRRST